MLNVEIGERVFFTYRNDYGGKTQASGLVLDISGPKVGQGPEHFTVSCDTPDVWIGTRDPKTNTRTVHVPESGVWRLT